MKRTVAAVVQEKQFVATSMGQRVHLIFRTVDDHNIIIRAPIEDEYLANIDPNARVYFWRDRQGYHHLKRQSRSPVAFWRSLFSSKNLNSTEFTL
jgi:hypothetical protein